MSGVWISQKQIRKDMKVFFGTVGDEVFDFGRTVNQTFEAFVLAAVCAWYKGRGWKVTTVNPKNSPRQFRLKFNTRGRPSNYSYFRCVKEEKVIQIRHGLRAKTLVQPRDKYSEANICLDVAVIKNVNLSEFKTDNGIENEDLISFGEAKHMPGYAELVASFLGMVHELQPFRLAPKATGDMSNVSPFLYVSGFLRGTGLAIQTTASERGFDIEVFHIERDLADTVPLAKYRRVNREDDSDGDSGSHSSDDSFI